MGKVAGKQVDISGGLDFWFGSAQGSILYRDASAWKVLGPGTSGQMLQSGGANANPSWTTAALAGSGTVTTSGSPAAGQFAQFTSATAISTATAGPNQLLAGPASGTASGNVTARGLVNADVIAGLGYQPARPSQAISGNFAEVPSIGTAASAIGSVSFTATATSILFLANCNMYDSGEAAGAVTGYFYVDLYDSTAAGVVVTGTSIPVSLSPSDSRPNVAILAASGLTIGHSYVARVWAFKNNNGYVHVQNSSLAGIIV